MSIKTKTNFTNDMFKIILLYMIRLNKICDVLCDLVSFVQFEKREYTHGGVLLLESSTPPQVFFSFFKLYKQCQTASHMVEI